MAYQRYIYRFPNSIEYEYKFVGNYGAKGEKRKPKQKATPEQIKKQNQWKKENYVRRLIKLNFEKWDHWITLKYTKGVRKKLDEVKKDLSVFLRKMRNAYKRLNKELKFIYRLEIGKHGGIHIHMILPRIKDADILIQENWCNGSAYITAMYEAGDYEQLADYIVKPPKDEEEQTQMSLFPKEQQKQLLKYSTSRNLIRPVPEKKIFTRRTVKKLIEEGPTASAGFYVDKSTIRKGTNQWTGLNYLYYTEFRINKRGKERANADCKSIYAMQYQRSENTDW